jgi:hypothetical protein
VVSPLTVPLRHRVKKISKKVCKKRHKPFEYVTTTSRSIRVGVSSVLLLLPPDLLAATTCLCRELFLTHRECVKQQVCLSFFKSTLVLLDFFFLAKADEPVLILGTCWSAGQMVNPRLICCTAVMAVRSLLADFDRPTIEKFDLGDGILRD